MHRSFYSKDSSTSTSIVLFKIVPKRRYRLNVPLFVLLWRINKLMEERKTLFKQTFVNKQSTRRDEYLKLQQQARRDLTIHVRYLSSTTVDTEEIGHIETEQVEMEMEEIKETEEIQAKKRFKKGNHSLGKKRFKYANQLMTPEVRSRTGGWYFLYMQTKNGSFMHAMKIHAS